MRLLSTSLAMGFFIIVMALGAPLTIFIDIPSILIVLGPVLAVIIAHHGFHGFQNIFKVDKSTEVLKSIGTTAQLAGLLGSAIGIILMLQNLNDPAALGPAIAVSLLSPLLGMGLFLLTYFLNKEIEFKGFLSFTPLISLSISLIGFFILLLSFSKK